MASSACLSPSPSATAPPTTKPTVSYQHFSFHRSGKERHEVGRVHNMTINPCKSTEGSFTKFTSNALGDPYIDTGKYNSSLRGSSCPAKPFTNMHGNRTVKKSEFAHMADHKTKCPTPEKRPGFFNRKTSEPFTNMNGIGY